MVITIHVRNEREEIATVVLNERKETNKAFIMLRASQVTAAITTANGAYFEVYTDGRLIARGKNVFKNDRRR